jgi:hypothetical protein
MRGFGVEAAGDVAHHVLDELRIVVSAFGDVLLVGALEQAVELAGGLSLDKLHQFFDPQVVVGLVVTVTCERWLCAPRSEISFEQGHRLVTGTATLIVTRGASRQISPIKVTS